MASRIGVELWVKAEPFSYGALPVAPHPRLNFTNIKKIVIYAKNKGTAGFPKLSYQVWKHIACNKLHLTEDLAWVYFETCHFLSTELSPIERIERDAKFAACKIQEEGNQLRDLQAKYAVDTLKFVLFLYIQQIHRVSLRASLVAGDEWPTQSLLSSTGNLDGRSTPRGTKSLDDHSHLVFLQSNLSEIIELLSQQEGNYSGGDGSIPAANLTLVAIEALEFLIAGSTEKLGDKRKILPLHEIAMIPVLQYKNGFNKFSRTFASRPFMLWVKDCLNQNPYCISACIALGTRLSWHLGGEEDKQGGAGSGSTKRVKIATNAQIVPKEHITGNKLIIMSQVSKQTIARSSGTLEMSTVKIHRSHYSYLYLLSPLRSVTVEKCRNTTVVLGPVEAFVHVSNCENVVLIAPCRRIMISGSTLCKLYLMTPNRPMLLSGNDTITLAPYHTFYPCLEEHMSSVGISPVLNFWDRPICIGPDHRDDMPIWELLHVNDFHTFSIPFQMEGPTKSIPGGLPGHYQRAITLQQKQIDNWQQTVREASLTREQRKEFQALVESRFSVWLTESGHKLELDSLATHMQQHDQST